MKVQEGIDKRTSDLGANNFLIFDRDYTEFNKEESLVINLSEDMARRLGGRNVDLYKTLNWLQEKGFLLYKKHIDHKESMLLIEIAGGLVKTVDNSKLNYDEIERMRISGLGLIRNLSIEAEIPSIECAVRLRLGDKGKFLYMQFVNSSYEAQVKQLNYGSFVQEMTVWLLQNGQANRRVDISQKLEEHKYMKGASGLAKQIIPDKFKDWRLLFIPYSSGTKIELRRDVSYGDLKKFGTTVKKMEEGIKEALKVKIKEQPHS